MDTNALAQEITVVLNMERLAAGLTLEGLASQLGMSEQTLGRYLTRHERGMKVDVLTRACAIIGVPVAEVVETAERRLARKREEGSSDAG